MERRQLLKAGISAAAFVSFAGLGTLIPKRAQAATLTFNLQASAIDYTPPGLLLATPIPMWQFGDTLNTGLPLATQLRVNAGDTVIVNLTNSLAVPVNFVVPGVYDSSPACPPGGSFTYTFTAPATPGSFPFYDDRNGMIGRSMGLAGALIVEPADGSATLGGRPFTRDHTLLLGEVDSRLNLAVAQGLPFDMNTYAPDYFFVNGRSYVRDTTMVELLMTVGESVAFRLVNVGQIFYPMHYHGYHVSVMTRNGRSEGIVVEKDTVLVKPAEAVEALLFVNQPGLYPLHTHYLPGVTNGGVYAGGGLMMMNAA